jgi:hypothetical protein
LGGDYSTSPLAFTNLSAVEITATGAVTHPSLSVNAFSGDAQLLLRDMDITGLHLNIQSMDKLTFNRTSIGVNIEAGPWTINTSQLNFHYSNFSILNSTGNVFLSLSANTVVSLDNYILEAPEDLVFSEASLANLSIAHSTFSGVRMLASSVSDTLNIDRTQFSDLRSLLESLTPTEIKSISIQRSNFLGLNFSLLGNLTVLEYFNITESWFQSAPIGTFRLLSSAMITNSDFINSPIELSNAANSQPISVLLSKFLRSLPYRGPMLQVNREWLATRGLTMAGNDFSSSPEAVSQRLCDVHLNGVWMTPESSITVPTLCIAGDIRMDASLTVKNNLRAADGAVLTSGNLRSHQVTWTFYSISYDASIIFPVEGVFVYWASNPEVGMLPTSPSADITLPSNVSVIWGSATTRPTRKNYPISSQVSLATSLASVMPPPNMPLLSTESGGEPFLWSYDLPITNSHFTFSVTYLNICTTSPPSTGAFRCNNGVWEARDGDVVVPGGTVIVGPITVINGSITVEGDVIFTPGSIINAVNACVVINGQVQVELTPEEIEELFNYPRDGSRILVTQSGANGCLQQLSTVPISIKDSKQGCKKLKAKNGGTSNQLSVLFEIDSSACNTKWIILGSVLGGVLLITLILVLIFTLVPSCRHKVRPYAQRSGPSST